MGWSSGTDIAIPLIESIKHHVLGDEVRQRVYRDMIRALQAADWDTEKEAMGIDPAFDAALKELYPDWFAEAT